MTGLAGNWPTRAVAAARAVAMQYAADVDEAARFSTELFDELRASGLLGLLVPTAHGGLGGDLCDLVAVTAQLAEGCLSGASAFAMHSQQVDVLVRHADSDLAAWLLPRVATGDLLLASLTTERGSGGVLDCQQALARNGDSVTLKRESPVVSGGRRADGFLMTMRAGPDATPRQVSLVYADRDQLAVSVGPAWSSMGMRGMENVALTVSGQVSARQIVGPSGEFGAMAVETFAPVAHLGWSAAWLGAVRGAFSSLLRLIRRGDEVRADPRSALVQYRLARVRMRLEVVSGYLGAVLAEVMANRVGGGSVAGSAAQVHLNTLKVFASEEMLGAANDMVELAGLRIGYLRDSPIALERLVRDLRAAALNHDNTAMTVSTGALCLVDPAVHTLGHHGGNRQ